jgi:hypothetical protein
MWLALLACFSRLPTDTGADPADSGSELPPAASESACDDGLDEDADGATDCDDEDCAAACPPPDTGEPPDEVCYDAAVGRALGWDVARGRPAGDDGAGSCGGSGRTDWMAEWTAPANGTYSFDTVGSSVDTVLWVADDSCDGRELACNDDTLGDASAVTLSLRTGDVLVLGVEALGAVQVNVWQGSCADLTIGQETSGYGSSEGADTTFTSACSPEHYAADVVLRWVAPATGGWWVSTEGSDYDTLLSIREDGCDEDANELACNDDADADEFVYTSAVRFEAVEGESYLVAIGGYDGYTGTFELLFTPD